MAHIEADTKRIAECGNDLLQLTIEYKETIEMLYDRIRKITEFGVWDGVSAANFMNLVTSEKQQYDLLGEILVSYGNHLLDTSIQIDQTIQESELD